MASVLVPTHPSGSRSIGLCSRSSLSGTGVMLLVELASSTHSFISFSLNIPSLMTNPFDCMPLSLLRFIWPILLCHSFMSTSALWAFSTMVDFTSFNSRINIRPYLRPQVMSRPFFSISNHLGWTVLGNRSLQMGTDKHGEGNRTWWIRKESDRIRCELKARTYL